MNHFLSVVVDGLSNGSIYALLALALVTVYRTTGYLNFAQGELAMMSTFFVVTGLGLGLPIWLAIGLAALVAMAISGAIQLGVLGPLERKGHDVALIALLGLFLFVNSFDGAVWGLNNRAPITTFPSGADARVEVLSGSPPFVISYAVLGAWITVGILVLLWWLLLNKTKLGLAYRAVVSNRDSAELVGIRVRGMFALGWALAAIPGLFAGLLATQLTGTLGFSLMVNVLVFAFTAACLGGFDSPLGAVLGGLLVGLIEAVVPLAVPVLGTDSGLVIALVLLLLVLLVRPQGIFGRAVVARV